MKRIHACCWKPDRQYPRTQLPGGLSRWLLDPASLTLRMQQLCAGVFRVQVLSQQMAAPNTDEARLLGLRRGRRAMVRQVLLLCDEVPWVYARTIIPVRSLQGRLRRLARIGTRPLGGMLFADPGMQRGDVELACIDRDHPLYRTAMQGVRHRPAAIWGRRSVFRIASKPLLVSEVFLPAFPAACDARACRSVH